MSNKKEISPPCDDCGGRCCKYIAVEIDKPNTKRQYDHIRWYLAHEQVCVFIDHNRHWFLEFRSPCSYLDKKNRCTIYNNRPQICRNHGNTEEECEYYDNPYLYYFSTIESFESYLKKKGIDWTYKR